MGFVVETDASGDLVIPAVGPPGTRYAVEQIGDAITARLEIPAAEQWWSDTTVEQRLDWLRNFVSSLPPGVGLAADAVKREELY